MKRCTVGGQAVLEGVMMKTPAGGLALAVRKTDGSIVTEYTRSETRAKKGTFFGLPVVRGVVVFIESLAGGMRMTMRSAELFGAEAEPDAFEKWLAKRFNKSAMDITIGIAAVLAIGLAVGLFVFLPSLTTQLIPWTEGARSIVKSLTEGVVRLLIFLIYISIIAVMKDIRRLYMYHGAEHKTIACYEHEAEMTVGNAMRYSRLHPRCGTNYLFLVMAVSILFFAMLPYSENFLLRFATRLVFLPVVAGISYEVLRLAAASDSLLARVVRAPGMGLQYLTTREPTPDMVEVAFAAFNLAMDAQNEAEAKAAGQPQTTADEKPAAQETVAAEAASGADSCEVNATDDGSAVCQSQSQPSSATADAAQTDPAREATLS